MKKFIVLLFSMATIGCALQKAKKETVKTYFPSGKLRSITEVENGLRNGKEELYFENGNLFIVQYFKDDLPVDSVYQYDKDKPNELLFKGYSTYRSRLVLHQANGQIFSVNDFKENLVIDGIMQIYHGNGNLMSHSIYRDGKRDGIQVLYYFNGNIQKIAHYRAGQLMPPVIEFDSTGKMINYVPATE